MKKAVGHLIPFMEAEREKNRLAQEAEGAVIDDQVHVCVVCLFRGAI